MTIPFHANAKKIPIHTHKTCYTSPLLSTAYPFGHFLTTANSRTAFSHTTYSFSLSLNSPRVSSYFDLETPAPITPGSFSSPTLNSMPMQPVTIPTRMMVVLAISQNGELTSTFWQ